MASVSRVVDGVVATASGIPSIASLFSQRLSAAHSAGVPSPAAPAFLHLFPARPAEAGSPAAPYSTALALTDGSPSLSSLPLLASSEGFVAFAHSLVSAVVQRNLADVQTVLELYAPYEYLLSEASRLDAFLATEPSLDECEVALADVCCGFDALALVLS
jgi:hypothetical protein